MAALKIELRGGSGAEAPLRQMIRRAASDLSSRFPAVREQRFRVERSRPPVPGEERWEVNIDIRLPEHQVIANAARAAAVEALRAALERATLDLERVARHDRALRPSAAQRAA